MQYSMALKFIAAFIARAVILEKKELTGKH